MHREATFDHIRDAYRALVREYHPDLNNGVENPRLRDVTEAWEVLRDDKTRVAHLNRLESRSSVRAKRTAESQPTSGQSTTTSDASALIRVSLPSGMHHRGGVVSTRVAIQHNCPGCGGYPYERQQCELCDGAGTLEMRVRGSISIPPYVLLDKPVLLECDLELFGRVTMRVLIDLV